MHTRYDEKGKYFTKVVTKETVSVVLKTVQGKIQGNVHVRPDKRLLDEMNESSQFVAITEARVFNEQGDLEYQTEFLSLNRKHIIWVIPEEEMIREDAEHEG
jgi:hypothetical protein